MRATTSKCIIGLTLMTAMGNPIPLAAQQQQQKKQTYYVVKDLGTLGGTQAVAENVSNKGWVVGAANLAGDQTAHSLLLRDGVMTDLGTLGGPNSAERGGTVIALPRY